MGLRDFNIYDVIARNVRLYPQKEAWIYEERRYSFAEFGKGVDRLAYGLSKLGFQKGGETGSPLPELL